MTTITLDILVLCKDNPSDLTRTLDSISRARGSFVIFSVMVVDGSSDASCMCVADKHYLHSIIRYVSSYSQRVFGIYPSMNLALLLSCSDWCIFLNSGDEFHPSFSISSFSLAVNTFSGVACIFGRSEIVSDTGFTWIMPSARIRSITRWCRFFEPSHQSMFVKTPVAKSLPFDERSKYGADSLWKRTLINSYQSLYIPYCISRFYLGGVSSSYSVRILSAKLREPTRRPYEKLMEVLKYILFALGLMSPRLQYLRAEIIGFLF